MTDDHIDGHIDDHGGWPGVLGELADGRALGRSAARAALADVLAGGATPAQLAAFIVALRMKGETVEELVGLVEAMTDAAEALELPPDTIDIVGTGGTAHRRRKSLNVSTMACVVAAAAGARVCKHGNIRASSTSGSFDLLDRLGVPFDLDGAQLGRLVDDIGLGFCFARRFHPAMRHAGPVRAELGIPTVFNILGPLAHPGRVRRQLLGVGDPRMVDLVAGVLAARDIDHAYVVHGHGGMDELSLGGPNRVVEVRGGDTEELTVDASPLGLARVDAADLPGGSPEDNVRIARGVLAGQAGPARDIVVLNAGAALVVAGVADSIDDGVNRAVAAIDDGAAVALLERITAWVP